MKYIFLLWADEASMPAPGSPAMQQQMSAFDAFYGDATGRGVFQNGDPFQPSAAGQTVRVRDGRTEASRGTVSQGSEQLIGYYVLECKDDADAAAWAAKIPVAASGAIEVRPILAL